MSIDKPKDMPIESWPLRTKATGDQIVGHLDRWLGVHYGYWRPATCVKIVWRASPPSRPVCFPSDKDDPDAVCAWPVLPHTEIWEQMGQVRPTAWFVHLVAWAEPIPNGLEKRPVFELGTLLLETQADEILVYPCKSCYGMAEELRQSVDQELKSWLTPGRQEQAHSTKKGPTPRSIERANLYKSIKDDHPSFSRARVAMEANKPGVNTTGEVHTEDSVRNAYRAQGWIWERADPIR
jgi:hypothetical protein